MMKTLASVRLERFLCLLLAAGGARAQATWRPLPEFSVRIGHRMAYDPVRKRVVLFGGNGNGASMGDTWEWDGRRWELRRPPKSPSPRSAVGMAFDPVRKKVLLFGGNWFRPRANNWSWLADTWEWDGRTWTQLKPKTVPIRRSSPGMTTDWARSRIVMFGGFTNVGATFFARALGDTWEWDGKDWVQRSPRTLPPARGTQAFAFHAKTGRITMFGGHNNRSNWFVDTWEWDGKDWTQFFPKVAPPREYSRMTEDPFTGHVLLYNRGDKKAMFWKPSTWRWDGTAWTKLLESSPPGWRSAVNMAADLGRRRVLMFGGRGVLTEPWHGTWAWDGKTWNKVDDWPMPIRKTSAVHDAARDEFVVLESVVRIFTKPPLRTWTMTDDGRFRLHAPSMAPRFLYRLAMIYHPGLRKTLYLGHRGGAAGFWIWDGKSWAWSPFRNDPVGYDIGRMAWDGHRRKILYHAYKTGRLWEWDATAGWTRLTTPNPPSPRYPAGFGYDPARRRLVLFGGNAPGGKVLTDTWEWDGRRWQQMRPKTHPSARYLAELVYVPALGGLVLFGGSGWVPSQNQNEPFGDTWLWDGKDWTKLAVPSLPTKDSAWGPRFTGGVYDPGRQRIVAFYSFGPGEGAPKHLWEFFFESLTTTQRYPRPGERFQARIHLPGQGRNLFLLALSGSSRPGIPLRPVAGVGTELLPLSPDPLFWLSLGIGMATRLDAQGNGVIPLAIPNDSSLLWLPFQAAGFTLDAVAGIGAITNGVGLQVVR